DNAPPANPRPRGLPIHAVTHAPRTAARLGPPPQSAQHRPAVQVGHHYVKRNRGRTQVLGKLEPLHSARRGRDRKSFGLEVIRNELARGGIVVNDENATRSRRTAAV